MSRRWAMVGRNAELSRAVETLWTPTPEHGSVAFIGPRGAGKSRLLIEVSQALGERVLVVQVFGSRPTATTPFAAWHRFRPPPDLGLGQADIMRQIGARMATQARGRPIVVVADDLHLLDELSLVLLQRLVDAGSVKLVGTVTEGEATSDRARAFIDSDRLVRVRVEPLTFETTWELLAQILGGPVEESGARRLWQATGGRPLAIRHLVLPSLFTRQRGLWRLPPETVLAPSVDAELATARIDKLTTLAREALDLVLLGEPISLVGLAKLTSDAAVEEAEVEGFLRVVRDGRRDTVRLAHPVYREVLGVSDARRAQLLAGLAGVVQSSGMRRVDDWVRVASWLVDAGLPADPELLTAAAGAALASFDHPLARRLAEAALRDGPRLRAAIVLALVAGVDGEGPESLALLDRHRDLAITPTEQMELALARSAVAFNVAGDVGAPEALSDAIVETGTDLDGLASAMIGGMEIMIGDHETAYEQLLAVEDDTHASQATRLYATATTLALDVQRGVGSTVVSQIVDVVGRALRQGGSNAFLRTGLEYVRLVAAVVTGEVERVVPRAQGHAAYDVVAILTTAASQRLRGRVREARAAALDAAALAARGGLLFPTLALAEAAQCAALLGDQETALAQLAAADQAATPAAAGLYPWISLARAQVQASGGHLDDAAATLLGLLDRVRADGFIGAEVPVLHALARCDRVTPAVVEAARRLAATVPGLYPQATCLHVTGLAVGDQAALRSAAGIYDRLGLHLFAAEATAHRVRVLSSMGMLQADLVRHQLGIYFTAVDARHTPALSPYVEPTGSVFQRPTVGVERSSA